ncbi:MAG: glutamine--fructose-6-phosphate transaminase (isomerizing) [Oceanicaulis sp.]|jgi:glucosamine--fructose-6-phosphate aminotransferase (isomerizing)|uniref:glutamine--fructose-6-phosphate transaminase (isomerizing) n=1 Tax=unclassified Oceanicaulis TaxID=2632123 RepID=UPI000066A27A|nr:MULTISPECIES: glutamine--fructose-6-phosphate transaminase (isomerizing) [unclassified Oceanicaulis]EAP90084.1 D-fructose-6-phosphate amidotransferase [Oceanicaulis sp. HTCC2633]MAB68412.1 glutamine--fructose-6-phosphate transaminase (isomerizing) [Oceanicaulis sp.]HBU62320.1 glutamine--fructose-6-phosphate transaminase (isomerizing) [Oceanicaulis sp.]
MCGIVGIVGSTTVTERLVEGLRRLEYRGYDSAGVAVITPEGVLERRRAPGKISGLDQAIASDPADGAVGIGHTRWATHGAPTLENAHPHASGPVAIVHNGIIENYAELREELKAAGFACSTPTDSEVIAHLIAAGLKRGLDMAGAFHAAVDRLRGAYALAALNVEDPDALYVARSGCPLVVGLGETEGYVGSDSLALAGWTNKVIYLEEGDRAIVTAGDVRILDAQQRPANREVHVSRAVAGFADKGEYRHFMEKEIHEQPDAIAHTLSRYVDVDAGRFTTDGLLDWKAINRLLGTACGTAFYAAAIGKYWFEKHARLSVEIDVASEFRYRDPVIGPKDAALFISQSGETADTLAALRYCKQAGAKTLAVVNVAESSIAREADAIAQTQAGPEIGVASTKAFTAQLTAIASLAIGAGRARGVLTEADEARFVTALLETPRLINAALGVEPQIEKIAQRLTQARDVLYLGRGVYHPLAMEGALKLKEISYIHAEGYAAGELKHGPIALIEEGTPVVVAAPHDALFEKTLSNMQEVAARGAEIILITDEQGAALAVDTAEHIVTMPECPEFIRPIVAAAPIQLLAYHTASLKGTDVDQPRNLAKSVTVE